MFGINRWLYKIIMGKNNIVEVFHYTANFITIDNKKHEYSQSLYINPNALICSIPDYLMIPIKSQNYIKDDTGIMYPLQNVISIEWIIDSKINVVETSPYKIFYSPFDDIDDLRKE